MTADPDSFNGIESPTDIVAGIDSSSSSNNNNTEGSGGNEVEPAEEVTETQVVNGNVLPSVNADLHAQLKQSVFQSNVLSIYFSVSVQNFVKPLFLPKLPQPPYLLLLIEHKSLATTFNQTLFHLFPFLIKPFSLCLNTFA